MTYNPRNVKFGLGFGRPAMHRVQNHKEGGIGDVYDQHDYAAENKKIIEAVCAHLLRYLGCHAGKEKIPPQGARVDVAFAGDIKGRITGSVHGVDYLRIRADGRIDLDTRATIETNDGHRIGLSADGVGHRA